MWCHGWSKLCLLSLFCCPLPHSIFHAMFLAYKLFSFKVRMVRNNRSRYFFFSSTLAKENICWLSLKFHVFKKFKIIIYFVIFYILFLNKNWHLPYSFNHFYNKYLNKFICMGFHCKSPIFYILVFLVWNFLVWFLLRLAPIHLKQIFCQGYGSHLVWLK